MAIKKVQIIPPNYTDVIHPETQADITTYNNSNSELVATNVQSAIDEIDTKVVAHEAEDASEVNVHGLRENNVILGQGSMANRVGSVVIGNDAKLDTIFSGISYSVVIGSNAQSTSQYSVTLGRNAYSSGSLGAIAIGVNAKASGSQSISLGRDTEASGLRSLALGNGAISENDNEGVLGNVGGNETNKWTVPGSFTVNGTKNFEIPHPKPEKKATHRIRHGAVESPTAGDTLYRFKVESTQEGDLQCIDLPDYFIWLNKNVQIFVTPQGHFGNGYGELNSETEQLEIHCQYEGAYNVLVIGTRNDDHQSVRDWDIKGVEREIGESWTGETYIFSVEEIIEVEEIKEEVA